jgi:DNA invertase Pin-like site-specific DNA recombinase
MSWAPKRRLRCAVYTRKSSEEGLDMDFNSLDAQREACEAYIVSQKVEGWTLVPDRYDDGGFSGGNLDRPDLQRLMRDIEARRIDIVVVYKIDRLSRSLMDFAKLVEVFDRCNVTFVSVTQSFNTTTSMGRLTLNVLLSFAQFEREITSERLRDKVAASKKKGMWMGGFPVLGYDIKDRKLVANEREAKLVRRIFERFVQLGSGHRVAQELRAEGITGKAWTSKRGRRWQPAPMAKTVIYRLLNNRVYIGEVAHKGNIYPGEHRAIIDRTLWDKVQAILQQSAPVRSNATRARTPALLKGLIHGPDGRPMSPTHTHKGDRLYRYYVAQDAAANAGLRRVSATEIETAVVDQLRTILRSPEIVVRTWRKAHANGQAISEREVTRALQRVDPIWNELFPAEQARVIQLLVGRVDVLPDGMRIALRTSGLGSVIDDLREVSGRVSKSSVDA